MTFYQFWANKTNQYWVTQQVVQENSNTLYLFYNNEIKSLLSSLDFCSPSITHFNPYFNFPSFLIFLLLFKRIFCLHRVTCGTSLHRVPRTKPMPSAVEACRLNQWTKTKVLSFLFQRSRIIIKKKKISFSYFLLDSILADKMKTDFLLVQRLLVHYSPLEHMGDAWGLAIIAKYGKAQDKRDWCP